MTHGAIPVNCCVLTTRPLSRVDPMLRLNALDGIRLVNADGDPERAVAAKPLRLALLACLAFARPFGPQRRDWLTVLFWGEKSEERARHALSQALYGLRRHLGTEVVRSIGCEAVLVDRAQFTCDVCDFWQAVERREWARVVELHRTPLMEHFHVRSAGGFDRWLDDERRAAADAAFAAASRLVARAWSEGDVAEALRWARAARTLEPCSEAATRWVMALLALEGRRVQALQVFRDYGVRLRRELELDPDPATLRLAAKIRSGCPDDVEVAGVRPSPGAPPPI